jgi:hypothetical protein
MRQIIVLAAITITSFSAVAQKYRTAAGIRVGSGIGLSVQQYLWDKYTLEGIAQKNLFKSGTNLSILFESHNKILFKGLNFYLGAGPHFGFYGNQQSVDTKAGETTTPTIKNSVGLSAIGGLEMRFNRILLSYDYQPGINFTGGEHVFNSQTGVTVRYIFIKAKKKEKNWMFWKKWKKYDGGED